MNYAHVLITPQSKVFGVWICVICKKAFIYLINQNCPGRKVNPGRYSRR